MNRPERGPNPQGPWIQTGRLVFLALYALTLLAACGWLISNVRQINPDSQAVVLRFGAMQRIEHAGLLWAWPRPFEQVVILPSPGRVIEHRVEALLRSDQAREIRYDISMSGDALAGSGYLLTGDAGVAQLDVRVFYRITDPYAWVLEDSHVEPALNRLVERAAVMVCASRDLDTILVARPELVSGDSGAAQRRERLRGDLQQAINRSLDALATAGGGLGIEIERVDVQSSLPNEAVDAFNAVLTASQRAEQAIAMAQNDAARQTQAAAQNADRTLQVAYAGASERMARAQAQTADISNLAQTQRSGNDPGMLWRLYRARVATLFAKAGSVTVINPGDDAQLILQGAEPREPTKK